MFTKAQFSEAAAQEKLEALKGKYEFPKDADLETVNQTIDKILFDVNIYPEAPKYVLTRALYPVVEGGKELKTARFTVKPSSKFALEVSDLKTIITIDAGEDFYDKFVAELGAFFDRYAYHVKLQENLNALNQEFFELTQENEIPFMIQFSLGEGLLDASDDVALIGLSHETIEDLASLPLFDDVLNSRRESYKESIVDMLREANKPYDVVKVKSLVTKDLGIYSRRSLSKLLRNFVSRKVEHVRVGTGYKETDEVFAVISKEAVTEEELQNMDTSKILVIDNEKASAKEVESGKTKIVVSYKVAPFVKETGVATDVELKQLVH